MWSVWEVSNTRSPEKRDSSPCHWLMKKPCAIPNSSIWSDMSTEHSAVTHILRQKSSQYSVHWGGGKTKILNSGLWEFTKISMKFKIIHAPNDQYCARMSAIWSEIYPRYRATFYVYINIRHLPHTSFMWPCSAHIVNFPSTHDRKTGLHSRGLKKSVVHMFFVLGHGFRSRIWAVVSYLGSLESLIYFSTCSLNISCLTSQKLCYDKEHRQSEQSKDWKGNLNICL